MDLDEEYDIVQKIGEGWFSRVYLTEHRQTRQELVLKVRYLHCYTTFNILSVSEPFEYHLPRICAGH